MKIFSDRRRPFALALVPAAIVLAFVLLPDRQSDHATPATAAVDRGAVERALRLHGQARLRERFRLYAGAAGRLGGVRHAGEAVRAGERLAELQVMPAVSPDPRRMAAAGAVEDRAQDELRLAQARVVDARARLELAQQDAARLADARSRLRAAEFDIDVARQRLDDARTRIAHESGEPGPATLVVRAPLDGVILVAPAAAYAQAGTALFELGRPDSLEMIAALPVAAQVDVGTPGEAGFPVGALQWPVSVRATYPAADGRNRVAVRIDLPREQWPVLHDGDTVFMTLRPWRKDDVLRVPVAALFRQEDRWMVFRLRGDRAYATPVALGARGDEYAEVLDGLVPGDVVVLDPGDDVGDGTRVAAH